MMKRMIASMFLCCASAVALGADGRVVLLPRTSTVEVGEIVFVDLVIRGTGEVWEAGFIIEHDLSLELIKVSSPVGFKVFGTDAQLYGPVPSINANIGDGDLFLWMRAFAPIFIPDDGLVVATLMFLATETGVSRVSLACAAGDLCPFAGVVSEVVNEDGSRHDLDIGCDSGANVSVVEEQKPESRLRVRGK